jgi:hypothetical protein
MMKYQTHLLIIYKDSPLTQGVEYSENLRQYSYGVLDEITGNVC